MKTTVWIYVTGLALLTWGALGGEEAPDAFVPELDPAYIVGGTDCYYSDLDIRASEPRWLYTRQFTDAFTITGRANVITVRDEPVEIPDGLKPRFMELLKNSEEAQKGVEQSPMVGPERFFIVLSRDRKPNLLLVLEAGVIAAHGIKVVGQDYEFQVDGAWASFNLSRDVIEYLKRIKAPESVPETPFMRWRSAGTKKD